MFVRNSRFKHWMPFLSVVILMISLAGGAGAASNETSAGGGENKDVVSLDVYALRDAHGARLFIDVMAANDQNAPNELKHIQVKLTGTDGKHLSTNVYKNVSALGGKAAVDLGDVPLQTRVQVQALVLTGQTVNTEVLTGETAVAEFAVNPSEVVVSDFQGYGYQFNMHLYTALNDPARGFTGNEPPKDLGNVEAKVKALKPGLTRIFLSPVNFDRGNENRMESFIKTVELAQQAGAKVNITWWYIERAAKDDPVEQQRLMEENMHQFADTLIDLVKHRGLTAVRQITIQNEVNTTWIKPELYEQYYRLLNTYLKEAGIRDQIEFVGGDLVFNNQLVWLTYMAEHMGDVLDGWSVHIYWNYWDTTYMLKRISDIKGIYVNIPPDKRKPLSVTEYGTRGYRFYNNDTKNPILDVNPYRKGALTATLAGKYEDNVTGVSETNIAAFTQAWFNLLAVNNGFTGLAKWDAYRAQYDFTYQDHSLIGYVFDPAPGEDRWPLRPVYHMQRLLGNTTGQGWQVLGYVGAPGSKLVTPFRGPSGEWSVFALSVDQKAGSFTIGRLPANTAFQLYLWNADGSGKTTKAGSVNSEGAGTVTFDVPAGALAVLTTASVEP